MAGDNMSLFPNPNLSTSYCLTCAGTGKRGNLSGKKACKTCEGTGKRTVENVKIDKHATVLDTLSNKVESDTKKP